MANNLNALLAGSAPILDGEAIDLDLFERLAAKLGAAERLPGILVSQDESVPAASALLASSLEANGSSGHPDRIDIQDGLDLAEAMQQQKTAEDTLKGLEAGDKVLEDLESNLGEADSALETLASLPGADTNAIGVRRNQIQSVTRASNHVGWFLRAVEFINYYNAGVLPSRFDALAVSVRRPDGSPWIYEDDCSPAPVSALATVSSNSVEYGAEKSFLPEDLQQTALPEILPSFQRDIPTGTVTFGPAGVSVEGEWVPAFIWPDIEVAIGNLDNSDSMVEVNVREPDLPFKGQPRSAQGNSQIIGSEVVPEVAAYVGETGTATIEVAPKPVYFGGKTIERTAPYQLRVLNPLIFDYPQFMTSGDPILIRASLTADKQGLEQIEWQITNT